MACGATLSLKRSLEFDPLHSSGQHSPKRRRCTPMTMSPATPPTKSYHTNPSPFSEVGPKINSGQIAAHLSAEFRRMQRRKQLSSQHSPPASPPGSPRDQSGPSSSCESLGSAPASPSSSYFNALSSNKKEVPLFTFKQVSLVCERMLKEREDQIRSEYDKVLTCKLAEQYEAFLKFNHDQLHRRFNESAASYVS